MSEHILCECLMLKKTKMQTLDFVGTDPNQMKGQD